MSFESTWIERVYQEVTDKYHNLGLKDGMDIFYSPVIYKPRLLLIGDNPGGTGGNVANRPPLVHDYFAGDNYLMADKMKEIFSTSKLQVVLKESVKINRVFFQSKDIKTLINQGVWDDIVKWCFPYVQLIINKIEPQIILAESMGCYKALIYGFRGRFIKDLVVHDKKVLLRSGHIDDKIVLGINHPSSQWTRHIDKDQWQLVTQQLEEII